jgi:DNA polymerase (family 10)
VPVHNEDIARVFEQIADLLEIRGENPFRIRAYRNAAREVRALPREVAQMLEAGEDIVRLPGIGEALAAKIHEIVRSGTCRALEKLRRQLPGDLSALLRLPGLGPKRVHALHYDLDIHTPEQLYRAAKDHRLRRLPGFGPKTEARIAAAVEAHLTSDTRLKLAQAARYAEPLETWLASTPGADRVVMAGSYRRCKETVGDLDILVTASHPGAVMDRFTGYEDVIELGSRGTTRSTVRLRCGLRVDLRVVAAASFGAALHYFTGSRAHNIAVRSLARRQGLKINEYGVFRGRERIAGETEASVFAALGLPWIPPELREGEGELEAARRGLLPRPVERGDLRGDLHCHTVASDGHGSLADMAAAARAAGLEYLAITEHSKRLTMAHGLDSRRLLAQLDEIDRLNDRLEGLRLLKGIEVDILEDGSLDLPDEVLGRLDLVIGAVHSAFHLSRADQTRRILKAMDHPHFSILAHPTGRLIAEREPYDLDMARVIRHARTRGCYLELNAHPERLDLLDVHCRMAREEGVLVSIDSDAHNVLDFVNLRYGIGQARRGWLEAKDVLNTRPLRALMQLLRRTM